MLHHEGPNNPRAPPRIMDISHIIRNAFSKRTRLGFVSRINGLGLSTMLPRILHDSKLCQKGSNEIIFVAASYVQARLLCGEHRGDVRDSARKYFVHQTEIDGCNREGVMNPFVTYLTPKMFMRRILKDPESLNDATIILDDLEKKDLLMDSILICLHLLSSARFKDVVKFNLILLSTGRNVDNLLELFASDGSNDVDQTEMIDEDHGHVQVIRGNLLYTLNGQGMQLNIPEIEQQHLVLNGKECEFSTRSYHIIINFLEDFVKRSNNGAILVSLPNIEYMCTLRELMRRSYFLKSVRTYESYYGKEQSMYDVLIDDCISPQGPLIILDTGLAETIYIPNLLAVVDSGLSQRYYFDPPYNYERQQIELSSITELNNRANFSPNLANQRTYVNLAHQFRHQAPMVNPDEPTTRDLGLSILQVSKLTRIYRVIPFEEIYGLTGQNPNLEHIKGNISKQKSKGTIIRDDSELDVFITQFGIRVRHLDLPVDVAFAILMGKSLGIKSAAAKIAFLFSNGRLPIGIVQGLHQSFRYNNQLCRTSSLLNYPSSSDQIHVLEKYEEWEALRTSDPTGHAARNFLRDNFLVEHIFKSTSASLSMLRKRFPRLLTGMLGNSFTIYRGEMEETAEAFRVRIQSRNHMIMVLETIKHFPHYAVLRQGEKPKSTLQGDAYCTNLTCPRGTLYPGTILKQELAACGESVRDVFREDYHVQIRFAEEPLCGGVSRGIRGLERARLGEASIRHGDLQFHPLRHPYVLDQIIAKGVFDILSCNPVGQFLETEARVNVELNSINSTIINDFPHAAKIGGGVLVGSKIIYNLPNNNQAGSLTFGGTTLIRVPSAGLFYRLVLLTAPKIQLIPGQNGFLLAGIGSKPNGDRIDSTFDLAIPNADVPPHIARWALKAHTIRINLNRIISKQEKDYETVRIIRDMLLSFLNDEELAEALPYLALAETFEQSDLDELAYPFNSIPFPR